MTNTEILSQIDLDGYASEIQQEAKRIIYEWSGSLKYKQQALKKLGIDIEKKKTTFNAKKDSYDSDMKKEPHVVLGVEKYATIEDVKAAFIREAAKCQQGKGSVYNEKRYEDLKAAAVAIVLAHEQITPPSQQQVNSTYTKPTPTYTSMYGNQKKKNLRVLLIVVGIIVALIVIYNINEYVEHERWRSAQQAEEDLWTSREKTFPSNGTVNYFISKSTVDNAINNQDYGPLSIKVPIGSDNYYILLKKRSGGSNSKYLSIFIHPGKTVETKVPFGDYDLYYATGEIWYGEDYLFGPNTEFYQADNVFKFYLQGDHMIGSTVELIKQQFGNLDTKSASADDFK